MKKILMALVIAGLAYSSAEAQATKQVCRMSSKKGISCYKTKYAQNFPICKTDYGYAVCGETPDFKNSTYPKMNAVVRNNDEDMPVESSQEWSGYRPQESMEDMTPKSQSYPDYQENAPVPYGASYDEQRKGQVKYCYFGDNAAELNRNPYKGCPSPQYDGPDKAKIRGWRSE